MIAGKLKPGIEGISPRTPRLNLFFLFFFLISAPAAQAACASPAGNEGDIIYNHDYCVPQYCDGVNWIAAGHPRAYNACTGVCGGAAAAVGDVCADGSVYAGLSTDGNVPMYVQRCDMGQTWNGSACTGLATTNWNDGNNIGYTTTNVTNADTGQGNTATLVTLDSDSGVAGTQPHLAAQNCRNLNEDGHTDWYLPALNELNVMYLGHAAIGNFNLGGNYYWSSSEFNNTSAWGEEFGGGTQFALGKNSSWFARCARR